MRKYKMCHDEVGGVNGHFQVEVCGVSGVTLSTSYPPHISRMMDSVLDPKIVSRGEQTTLLPGEQNSFLRILDQYKKEEDIVAPTIYYK